MKTRRAPSYPPSSDEVDESFDFSTLSEEWKKRSIGRQNELLNQIVDADRLLKVRAHLQYQVCELYSEGKIGFGKLCAAIVRIEEVFQECTSLTSKCVFVRYLHKTFSKGYGVIDMVVPAIKIIFKLTPRRILKEGHHQEVLRQLLIWAAKDVEAVTLSQPQSLCSAKVVLLFIGDTKRNLEPWDMDGITLDEALVIAGSLRQS